MAGAAGTRRASAACLRTHTASSMPLALSRSDALAPYTPASTACTAPHDVSDDVVEGREWTRSHNFMRVS